MALEGITPKHLSALTTAYAYITESFPPWQRPANQEAFSSTVHTEQPAMNEASSALIAHHAEELPMEVASSSSDIHNYELDEDFEKDTNCPLEPPPGLMTFTRQKNLFEQHGMEDTEDTEHHFCCHVKRPTGRNIEECASYQPYNALRIIARPATKTPVFDNIYAQFQPFHFLNYGDPRGEIEELKRQLGWTAPTAVGKIYEHTGDDQWHYYVCGQRNFGQRGLQTPPKNEPASRACGRDIGGDVVVIKVGPLGQDFDVHFSMADLGRTLKFYKTGDSRTIYAQLVRKRRVSYIKMRMEPMNPITEQYMPRKYNCFLLCARPTTTAPVFNDVQAQVRPFALKNFGVETAEIKELKDRLRWGTTYDVGELYDRSGADDWYYFVYGQVDGKQKHLPKNEIASKACGVEIYGDVAIVRSSLVGSEDYPEEFTKNQLCGTLEFLQDER
ncbi:MAG: hypothetical protein OHK93_004668 [Ramalina farinacea]|uniref:Uncharacterized protein n=1 Tax=Ramalina farinacea TaxID=258253 RepID=A0AA43U0I9_9LECA|nr:hypothetical protein [Ramalina farinacea]